MTSAHAPVPMTTLLAHREWVRRLARSLVHDDASADDVEQRTWLAALRSPPAEPGSARAWLARVVRRQALDTFRAQGRRDRHERDGARGEPVRSAADVVAEAETQKRVVAAVCALAEPYRTTVLMRFFEDLPPREVARRLGVPVETVRTRQKRAAEMLRRELGGTDGREWLAALTPLLAAPRDGSGALGTTGGVAVKISTKAAVAVLLVAALGALLWTAANVVRDDERGAVAAAKGTGAAPASVPPADDRAAARPARTSRQRAAEADASSSATALPAATPAAPVPSRAAADAEFARNAVAATSAPRPSGREGPMPALASADDLLDLLAKKAEPALPLNELADDAAAFARGFALRTSGATLDPLGAAPTDPLADGTRLLFPSGCHRWDPSPYNVGMRLPKDLVIEGAGIDDTLVVMTTHLVGRDKVGVLTFRNLTIHCDDHELLGVGINVVRLDHVRVIGFDSRTVNEPGYLFRGQALALLAQDSVIESGFGSTPGQIQWFLGTSPFTTAQAGWLTIARFERCRFVGPFEKPRFSVFLTSPPAATVYSQCDLIDVTPLDRALIEHPEKMPEGWSPTYVRFEDCRVTYAPDRPWVSPADGAGRKRRDVSEINPAWRMPECPAPK